MKEQKFTVVDENENVLLVTGDPDEAANNLNQYTENWTNEHSGHIILEEE